MPRSSVPHPSDSPSVACFSVHARAEPGVMPRVLDLFAKRGLVPLRWHSARGGSHDDALYIDIQQGGLDRAVVARIAACLRQLAHVDTVMTWEKGAQPRRGSRAFDDRRQRAAAPIAAAADISARGKPPKRA